MKRNKWGETGRQEMLEFNTGFKKEMVRKMLAPGGVSASTLAKEVGVSQPTLSRWLREAGTVVTMTNETSPKDWTLLEKLRVILEAANLKDKALGEFLRREGLHEEQLRQWRSDAQAAFGQGRQRSPRATREAKRIRELERELLRKDRALAEASALLVLKKKAAAIWGDEDDDTNPENGS